MPVSAEQAMPIETNDDLMLIKKMGVKFGQGYFLGKPEIM